MTIAAIDFGRLYRDHLAASSRKPRAASAWDARAPDMKRKSLHGDYVDNFVRRIDLTGAETLLDVGCGAGAICLPIARHFKRVIGLDYSRGMLDALVENAAEQGLTNVEPLHLSWNDDWSAVPECDIVVASRSTMVEDMADALAKLDAKARKRVYLTNLVGGRFVDPAVLAVLGRSMPSYPDYIYTINILYSRGIHPRLDYIEQEDRVAGITDFEEFLARIAWSVGELSDDERNRLRDWFSTPAKRASGASMRWAFVSWENAK